MSYNRTEIYMNSQIQQKWSSQTIMPQVILISNGNIIQVALIMFQQELLRSYELATEVH